MKYKAHTINASIIFNSLDEAENFISQTPIFTVLEKENHFIVTNGWAMYVLSNEEDANAKCIELNAHDWQITETEEPTTLIDYEAQFRADVEFGKELINTFLIDNRLAPVAISPAVSLGLMQKFQAVDALCAKGDIKSVAMLLPTIATDAIYTEERKQKYIELLTKYVNTTYP